MILSVPGKKLINPPHSATLAFCGEFHLFRGGGGVVGGGAGGCHGDSRFGIWPGGQCRANTRVTIARNERTAAIWAGKMLYNAHNYKKKHLWASIKVG